MRDLSVCTIHIDRFLDGKKSIILCLPLPTDRYQGEPGGPWRLSEDGFEHDKSVFAIEHVGRTAKADGQIVPVKSVLTQKTIQVQVIEIRMVSCDLLSDDQIADLGYATCDQYMAELGSFLKDRLGWLLYVIPTIDPDLPAQ